MTYRLTFWVFVFEELGFNFGSETESEWFHEVGLLAENKMNEQLFAKLLKSSR
jgi:hypothetical protein